MLNFYRTFTTEIHEVMSIKLILWKFHRSESRCNYNIVFWVSDEVTQNTVSFLLDLSSELLGFDYLDDKEPVN